MHSFHILGSVIDLGYLTNVDDSFEPPPPPPQEYGGGFHYDDKVSLFTLLFFFPEGFKFTFCLILFYINLTVNKLK